MRLIDADELIDKITEYGHKAIDELENEGNSFRVVDIVVNIVRIVGEMPVIDAEPVKRGRWELNGKDDIIVYCNQCGIPQDVSTPYCAFCGAKMEGMD